MKEKTPQFLKNGIVNKTFSFGTFKAGVGMGENNYQQKLVLFQRGDRNVFFCGIHSSTDSQNAEVVSQGYSTKLDQSKEKS